MNIKKLGFLLLTAISLTVFAGNEGGHGGDPVAQSFVSTMKQVSLYLDQNPTALVRASRNEARTIIKRLQDSLGQTQTASLVQIVTNRPRDNFGVEKAAVSTFSPLKVLLHRESWVQTGISDREAVKKDQVILAAMELLLLIDLEANRYEVASRVFGNNYLKVLAAQDIENPNVPKIPENNGPLEIKITGRQHALVRDAVFQIVLVSKFSNCRTQKMSHPERSDYHGIMVAPNGNSWGATTDDSSEMVYEITRNQDGSQIRIRANAKRWDAGVTVTSWDKPLTGLHTQTFTFNKDQTLIIGYESSAYTLGWNKVGPLYDPQEVYGWKKESGFSCVE